MHICKAGLHCVVLTGLTPDGRCLACRRESHRRAQRKYDRTPKGDAVASRYSGTAKNMLRQVRGAAKERQ